MHFRNICRRFGYEYHPVASGAESERRRKLDKTTKSESTEMSSSGPWRSFICLFVVAAVLLEVTFRLLEYQYVSYTRANLRRLHTILSYELYMILISIFIWKRILSLFTSGPQEHFRSLQKPTLQQLEMQRVAQRQKRLVALLLAFTIFCSHLSYFTYYYQTDFFLYGWLCWICFVLVGWYIHVGAFLIGFSLVNFVVRAVLFKEFGQRLTAPIFRVWGLKNLLTNAKWQTCISIGCAVFLTLCGIWVTSGSPGIRQVTIPLRRFPADAKSFKIALVTDIHLGPIVGREKLQETVDLVNSMKPDLIALVGDLVDGSTEQLGTVVEPLRQLKSKLGTYFTTGNHEYYYGNVDKWLNLLSDMGIKTLRNNSTRINLDGAKKEPKLSSICLAGVDDVYAESYSIPNHGMNLASALEDCSTSPMVILLAHNPTAARKAVDDKHSIDLILSGHTHGGQMYVTAPIAYLLLPFLHGLYWPTPETAVYVTSGVFYFASPIKMFGLMEVTEILLVPKSR